MAVPPTNITTMSTAPSPTYPYISSSSFITHGLKPLGTCALNTTQADCSICLENYTQKRPASKINQCGHIFHKSCLTEWVEGGPTTCPMCRAQLFLPPPILRSTSNARRNMYERRAGIWNVPSLPQEVGADGERILRLWVRGTGVFDPDVLLERALRGQGMQRRFDTISQWRMGALGLGIAMGGGLNPSTSEAPLDY